MAQPAIQSLPGRLGQQREAQQRKHKQEQRVEQPPVPENGKGLQHRGPRAVQGLQVQEVPGRSPGRVCVRVCVGVCVFMRACVRACLHACVCAYVVEGGKTHVRGGERTPAQMWAAAQICLHRPALLFACSQELRRP